MDETINRDGGAALGSLPSPSLQGGRCDLEKYYSFCHHLIASKWVFWGLFLLTSFSRRQWNFTLYVLDLLKDLFVLTNMDATIVHLLLKSGISYFSKITLNFMSLWLQLSVKKKRNIKGDYQKEIELMGGEKKNDA